jgi:hypothetical protein
MHLRRPGGGRLIPNRIVILNVLACAWLKRRAQNKFADSAVIACVRNCRGIEDLQRITAKQFRPTTKGQQNDI